MCIRDREHTTSVNKPRTYNLIDIKDAKEVKPKDYTKSISTKEFEFIKKVKHEDGVEDCYNQQAVKVKVKKGLGLRSKYLSLIHIF